MGEEDWRQWLEAAWEFREEKIYKTLFGDTGSGIYTLDFELFSSGFGQASIDPRWLHDGVFECPPNNGRRNWLYVSSGLSNPWEQNATDLNEVSGLGCEFVFQCPQQSRWALMLLRRMVAFQRLLSVGRFPGKGVLQVWDRIPLRSAMDGSSSRLTWVLLTPTRDLGESQQLPSGRFHFIRFLGVTEDEAEYARQKGGDKLLDLLVRGDAAPITDPSRTTVLS